MAYYVFNSAADTDLTTKGKRLFAWHFSSGGGAAVVNLRNGSASGDILCQVQLVANASASQAYPAPRGLLFPLGVFVDWVSGAITGSVDID